MKDLMDQVETITEYTSLEDIKSCIGEERANRIAFEKTTIELYEMLALLTEGESRLLVKSMEKPDDLKAWFTLFKKYGKQTLARMMRVHREVMHPKGKKALKDL